MPREKMTDKEIDELREEIFYLSYGIFRIPVTVESSRR
jgi:hypothetical protein